MEIIKFKNKCADIKFLKKLNRTKKNKNTKKGEKKLNSTKIKKKKKN